MDERDDYADPLPQPSRAAALLIMVLAALGTVGVIFGTGAVLCWLLFGVW